MDSCNIGTRPTCIHHRGTAPGTDCITRFWTDAVLHLLGVPWISPQAARNSTAGKENRDDMAISLLPVTQGRKKSPWLGVISRHWRCDPAEWYPSVRPRNREPCHALGGIIHPCPPDLCYKVRAEMRHVSSVTWSPFIDECRGLAAARCGRVQPSVGDSCRTKLR